VIKDALERLAPIVAIALVFGVVYWLYRRRALARDVAKRNAWLKERRDKREGEKTAPPEA